MNNQIPNLQKPHLNLKKKSQKKKVQKQAQRQMQKNKKTILLNQKKKLRQR